MKITIEVDELDAMRLENFVNWALTSHIKEAVPSRDTDTAWDIRQALTRISSAIQDAQRKGGKS